MKTLITILILILIALVSTDCFALDADIQKAIYTAAIKHKVPKRELLKIAFVESSLRKNPLSRYNKNGTYDIGMFQINSIHWHTTCSEYNIYTVKGNTECAAKILSRHRKYAAKDPEWMARYHSTTPKHKMKYAEKLRQAEIYLTKRNIRITYIAAN